MTSECISNSTPLESLEVASINEGNKEWLSLPKTFTRPDLPIDNNDITKPSQVRQRKHLRNAINQPNFSDDFSAGLLIGANYTRTVKPIEILQSRNGGTYAFKSRLGWCVVGPVNRTKMNKVSCNHIAVNQAGTKEVSRLFFSS